MPRTFVLKIWLLVLAYALPFSIAQSYEKDLDLYLQRYYKNKSVPSISAGVYYKNKIVWLKTEGYADLENLVPANTKTIYRIASVSKSITAVAIMQLVEQKKIFLDEDVRKYLPWFPAKKWKFTIRQVLSHTSGIRNYHDGEFDSKNYFRNTKEAINFIAKDSLEFEPGTKFLYTTLGYNLLAGVIESVTGMEFISYLKKFIFNVCGMNNTFPEYQNELIYNRARGYVKNAFRKFQNAPLADLSVKFAGGGLISTSEDLLKFAAAIMNNKLIRKETLDTMLVQMKLKSGKMFGYSLGFSKGTDSAGRKYFYHFGGGTGFTSQLLIYPDENLASVYLINSRDRDLEDPAHAFTDIVLNHENAYPRLSAADRFMDLYQSGGIDTALVMFDIIKKDSLNYYFFTPDELVYFGNDLVTLNRFADAIKYFKFAVTEFPDKAVLYSGLADAYFRDGNKGLALKNYRIASKLDPLNKYYLDMIKKLEKQ